MRAILLSTKYIEECFRIRLGGDCTPPGPTLAKRLLALNKVPEGFCIQVLDVDSLLALRFCVGHQVLPPGIPKQVAQSAAAQYGYIEGKAIVWVHKGVLGASPMKSWDQCP